MGGATGFRFVVPGPPQPKERPRIGKGGRVYTPRRTHDYEGAIQGYALASRPPAWALKHAAGYVVRLRVYFPDERRRDLDNVLKAALDALNGIAWNDDSQVRELHVHREVDRHRPRIDMLVETRAEVREP